MMKKSGLLTSWSEAIASRNIVVASNLILSILLGVVVLMLFFQPPHTIAVTEDNVFGNFEVQGGKSNQHFQQSWAFAVANLLGNIDPGNAKFVKQAILNVLSPRLKVEMEPLLDKQVELIQQRGVKQVFIVDDLIHEPETDLIAIWGRKVTYINNKQRDTERWTYEMKIIARNGKPRVVYLNQYKGSPRKRKSKGDADDKHKIDDTYFDAQTEIEHLKQAKILQDSDLGE